MSDNFLKMLPLLGAYFIACGITRLSVFFQYFNIRITAFLDFSEIITSFLSILLPLIITSCYLAIVVTLTASKGSVAKLDNISYSIVATERFSKRLLLRLKLIGLLSSIIVIPTSIYFLIIGDYSSILWLIIILIASFILFVLIMEFRTKIELLLRIEIPSRTFLTVVPSFLFILMMAVLGWFEANRIEKRHLTFGSEIIFNDGTKLVSDSTNYLVGKTTNYIFYFRSLDSRTDVYPMSTVKSISLKHFSK